MATSTIGVDKISSNPDIFELTVRMDTSTETHAEFKTRLSQNAARRLLIDLVHEVDLPTDPMVVDGEAEP